MCPAKYRWIAVRDKEEECIKQTCVGITLQYEWISFLEIGAATDYVHFLI